ncbi:NUDIX hydrolase [Deinococcus cavernae]|uniref:NUDIX hydrolase n=1 Tax=Deinococcus cavernae TaxID=2320857 RepID=A0A418VAT5_9DEIO|nr:NUDIX hydrolase [Deinococcus cavernae]RJF73234.1 NUDIX hydrolase [Deinococcus cavernae]
MFRQQARFYVNARAIIERPGAAGREVLLQQRQKPGEARLLEFPGGQLELFEGMTDALKREVREETGLTVTGFLDALNETRRSTRQAEVQCLTPSFVYQTLRGPVDSVGFFFRVTAEGELTRQGDHAGNHQWIALDDLRQRFDATPEHFDWLTQGALAQYLQQGRE